MKHLHPIDSLSPYQKEVVGDKMSNSSLSSSPARSSVSTTALVAGTAAAANLSSSPLVNDDYNFPTDLISMQDRKEEVCKVLKTDVMVALNKVVKSLDEDSWMFEGPRSRIHLISKSGGLQRQHLEIPKSHNLAAHK